MLPARKELLDGVLAANLIGFHTSDYARHFQKCAQRILGATQGHDMLTYKGVTAQLGVFPIGIDPHKFIETLKKPSIEAVLAEYQREFKGRKVLLGIDRLDYIKGTLRMKSSCAVARASVIRVPHCFLISRALFSVFRHSAQVVRIRASPREVSVVAQ